MYFSIGRRNKIYVVVLIILITIVNLYGSFSSSYFSSETEGLTSKGESLMSHEWFAYNINTRAGDSGEENEQDQSLFGFGVNINVIKIVRRVQRLDLGNFLVRFATCVKFYFISLCAVFCAYLFLPVQVSFIHLKDGSK